MWMHAVAIIFGHDIVSPLINFDLNVTLLITYTITFFNFTYIIILFFATCA